MHPYARGWIVQAVRAVPDHQTKSNWPPLTPTLNGPHQGDMLDEAGEAEAGAEAEGSVQRKKRAARGRAVQ